jgi:NADH:ubiquinone oxidoreductase subunit E
MIVQELTQIQERRGYLPKDELKRLSQRLNVPLHRLHEVASFYPLFRLEAPPAVEVKVCRDMACHLRGADSLRAGLENFARMKGPKKLAVEGVSCLGQCDCPVAVSINHHVYRGSRAGWPISRQATRRPLSSRLADRSLQRRAAL